ncbi:hypothetical protein GF359_03220 [candidate division WOR-3 bacterium]|uniref:Outer membrane protein beta-barrel domain-containing protein n=1 Tax=candidate division WOR-3 bacterium TaxID=2052148 RepID=A0A9D5KAE1_UNCW3|nr:hypothetical protein [candidate division WOR-3 bacterium]MBD3364206.1 hypothetical protein [candidate division WOR-3 bacterium]
MKRTLLSAVLVLTAVGFATESGGLGGPMVVGVLPDYGAFNAALDTFNTRNYGGTQGPEFSGPMIFIGGQGYGFVEGFSVGGWGAGFFKEATGDSSKAVVGYGMGYGEFGYRINLFDLVWLKPALLLGGGGMGLHIGRYRSSGGFGDPSDDFDNDEFFSSEESYQAGKGFVNVGALVDATLVFPMNDRKTALGGLNVKAGYLYAIYDSEWWDEDGYARNVDFNTNGPFLSVGVVFGGKGNQDYDEGWDEEW